MRRTRTALATSVVIATLLLAGCGGEDTSADESPTTGTSTTSDEPTEDASADAGEEPEQEESDKPLPQGPFADLTFKDGNVAPNGERLELGVGETLTLRIDADAPGELHVHSTPEQEIGFPAGQSERKLTIEQPGVVDVEDHESGKVLLQLEVQ